MATPTTLPASFVSGAVLEAAQLNNLRGAFRVLQVVQTVKTDTYSMSSGTFTDVTGFSATITPSATSSLVLVLVDLKMNGRSGLVSAQARLLRGSTAIYIGDAAGNRQRATSNAVGDAEAVASSTSIFLDNPATTSATTYKIQVRANTANNIYVNRAETDDDTAFRARYASSLTLMEISA